MVVLRVLGTVGLVEILIDISLGSIVVLQLVVAEHSQTGEGSVTWLVLQTLLTGCQSVLKVTLEIAGTCKLVQISLVELCNGHLLEFVVG